MRANHLELAEAQPAAAGKPRHVVVDGAPALEPVDTTLWSPGELVHRIRRIDRHPAGHVTGSQRIERGRVPRRHGCGGRHELIVEQAGAGSEIDQQVCRASNKRPRDHAKRRRTTRTSSVAFSQFSSRFVEPSGSDVVIEDVVWRWPAETLLRRSPMYHLCNGRRSQHTRQNWRSRTQRWCGRPAISRPPGSGKRTDAEQETSDGMRQLAVDLDSLVTVT